MKNLALPILTLLLFVSCNKDSTLPEDVQPLTAKEKTTNNNPLLGN